jgi:hypothetical protein
MKIIPERPDIPHRPWDDDDEDDESSTYSSSALKIITLK